LLDRVDHPQPSIFGFRLEYIFFLLGIVVLWFLVGRLLDRRQTSSGQPGVWTRARLVFVGGPLALYGAFFLYNGLQGLTTPWRWNNYWGNIAQSILVLLWSLVLIGIPALKLAQRFRTAG
jgi:ABC-type phosphate/phosphonate transport system permease subunit